MVNLIQYECPVCEVISSVGDWNDATYTHYGGEISTIQQSERDYELHNDFICPRCQTDSMLQDMLRHSIPLATNEKAIILLKREWDL